MAGPGRFHVLRRDNGLSSIYKGNTISVIVYALHYPFSFPFSPLSRGCKEEGMLTSSIFSFFSFCLQPSTVNCQCPAARRHTPPHLRARGIHPAGLPVLERWRPARAPRDAGAGAVRAGVVAAAVAALRLCAAAHALRAAVPAVQPTRRRRRRAQRCLLPRRRAAGLRHDERLARQPVHDERGSVGGCGRARGGGRVHGPDARGRLDSWQPFELFCCGGIGIFVREYSMGGLL